MTVLKFLRTPPLVLSAHLSSAGHLLRQHRWLPCSAAARGAVFAGSTCSIARRQLPYSAPVVLYADSFRIAAGRIVRRQLPCRALVVLRVDSFRSAAGLLPSGFWVAPPSAWARRFLLEFGSVSQFHTCGCYSFDCPASPEKEDPSATAATSALYSAGPVVSDLHLF